jgi:hypothetical protein
MSKQTHQQILEDAITVAIAGGFELVYPFTEQMHDGINKAKHRVFFGDCTEATALIFDQDFAKSLWGNQPIITRPDTYGQLTRVHQGLPVQKPEPSRLEALLVEAWRYHLQRMVVAEDAIVYLGQNI